MKNSYRRLFVWQASVQVAVRVCEIAGRLPNTYRFGLGLQLQRAAVSIPSNIAEGQGRLTNPDCRHFLSQARGSLYELETQLEIAERLGLMSDDEIKSLRGLLAQIGSGLSSMIRYLSS